MSEAIWSLAHSSRPVFNVFTGIIGYTSFKMHLSAPPPFKKILFFLFTGALSISQN